MQAMGRAHQLGLGAARTFPPTQLEWIAAQEKARMALDVGCFNGELYFPHLVLPSPPPPSFPQRGQLESAGPSLPWD